MSKSYKVVKKTMNMGEKKGQTVYSVRPVSYGLLTSDEVAKQISAESTATPGDVKAVLDRYAYYVKENLKKGYSIELLGFGTLYLRFLTGKAVSEEKKANASLVKTIVPAFRPSFTMLNGSRIYSLLPDKVTLVKYGEDSSEDSSTGDSSDAGKNPSGGSTSGDSGTSAGSGTSGNSGTSAGGGTSSGDSGTDSGDGNDGNID